MLTNIDLLKPLRTAFFATILLVGSGCVTSTTGGMPGPAPETERVAAQLDLARGYLEKRDWNRAKAPLARALDIEPNNVEAHILSAVVMQAQNEPKIAEDHYKRGLRIEPSNPQLLNNYAGFLYSQERYEEAVTPLEKLVDNTSYRARPQAFESLGLSYLRVGEPAKAEAALRRALQLNVRLPRANLELTEIALDAGDLPLAETHFDFHNRLARPSARSLCLGLRIARATNDADQEARFRLSLNNLFPDEAEQCRA